MVDIAQLAPPWMPADLVQDWYNEYLALGGPSISGSAENAAEVIRSDTRYQARYDLYFPGNRREDGSLRLTEQHYRTRVSSFENSLMGVNVNPEVFSDKFAGLIEGNVGEAEFNQRVESMYERVIEAAPSIRNFYATNYAMDMTDSAIVASFLDPDVGNKVLDRSIAISEIGGEAAMRNFNIEVDFATRLQQAGVSRDQAQGMFGTAATEVPALNILAARHADPDDDFDINEFTQATIFDDPIQRRRMRRLIAQERAGFTGGRAGTGFTEDRGTGGFTGLGAR